MSALPKEILEEVRLLREAGLPKQSLRLIELAKRQDPHDDTIVHEHRKVIACSQVRYKRCRQLMADVVDFLGVPMVFVLAALLAILLGPILFIPSW